MTFVDVTDSVNVERALKDKNEALQKADQLKNDFVQHVSYELRSPLTNIIGFTELLTLPGTGPLTAAAARICRPYRLVVLGAADHRQRHPRPCHRRRRHHGARHRRSPDRSHDQRRRRNWYRTGCANTRSRSTSMFRGRRRTSMATRTASARFSSICSAMPRTTRRKAASLRCLRNGRGRRTVLRARRRSGHAARGPRHGVPPLRAAHQWRPAARRRLGLVDREELRRAAWRHRADRSAKDRGTTVICRFPMVPLRAKAAAE